MPSLPSLLIASSTNYPSAQTLDGRDRKGKPAPSLRRVPMLEAFDTEWTTEAHFYLYDIENHHGPIPRLSKNMLPQLMSCGSELSIHSVVLDIDTDDHKQMSPFQYQDFQDKLAGAYESGLSLALDWTVFYVTRAGIRLVYVLEEPIHPEIAEGLHKGMIRDFKACGVDIICSHCFDWTHGFRLPRIVRDGKRLSELPLFELIYQEDNRLHPDSIEPKFDSLNSISKGPVQYTDTDKPIPEEVHAYLFEMSESGKEVQTKFYTEAKRRLRGRECFECVFEGATVAQPGSRNATLHQYVGQAVSLLAPMPISTPEHIYSLFYETVLTLDPDEGDPDWTETLWRQISYCWAHEEAKIAAEMTQCEPNQDELEGLIEKVREWCDAEELQKEASDARWWLLSHVIADTGTACYIMKKDGRYDSMGLRERQIPGRVRELGMEGIIPLWIPKTNGEGVRPRTATEILAAHATSVDSVEGRVGDFGGLIRNIGQENARLVVTLYRRRKDIMARYSPEVDTWLRLLGGESYEKLCEWIGHALAFEDGPICALSIAGSPGIGKKLLAQGLAECINTETIAAMEALDNFHHFLLYTPFVIVNEGITETRKAARDIADTFRHYTAGDPIEVNIKYKPPITVRSPLRMIFTTNNTDTIGMLTSHRDLTNEDRAALALRLFHINANNDAAMWLEQKGGLNFTRGWIYGDAGNPSTYKVAKHFLWLHGERTRAKKGNRLLVEGDMSETIDRMATSSGSAPSVIECILRMIENPNVMNEGIAIGQGEIWVTASSIVDFFRKQIGTQTNLRLDVRQCSKVLRGLSLTPAKPRTINVRGKAVRSRWYQLDPYRLQGEAVEYGYPHSRLDKVMKYYKLEHEPEELQKT